MKLYSLYLLLFLGSAIFANEIQEIPCTWNRLTLDGGGFIGHVVVSPHNSSRVYCCSDKGGIHRSDDGGRTWQISNKGFRRETFHGVSDLIIDPRNPKRVFAATGNAGWAFKHYYPGAVFRSDDGGKSWRELARLPFCGEGGPGKGFGNRLCFDPGNPDIIYAATHGKGLFRSSNSGEDWQLIGLQDKFLTGILVDPDNSNILLASAWQLPLDKSRKGGIFESRDGGKTWRALITCPEVVKVLRATFNPDWLVAACNKEGIRFSRDRGKNWEKIPMPQQMKYIRAATFQPGHKQRLYVLSGGEGSMLFYTDDFGKTWTKSVKNFKASLSYPKDWYIVDRGWRPFTSQSGLGTITFDPKNPEKILLGDYHTVWCSDNDGKTWTACPGGINTLCVYQIVIDPKNPKVIYVNNADMGLLKSSNGGVNFRYPFWNDSGTGDSLINETAQLLISPENTQKLAISVTIEWHRPIFGGVYISDNGGQSWQNRSKGIPAGFYVTGLTALTPDQQQMLVAVGNNKSQAGNVYYTANRGRSWTPFGSGLPKSKLFGTAFTCLPNLVYSGKYIYAATLKGLYRATLEDTVWKKIGTEFKNTPLRTIEVSPQIPECAWVGTGNGLYFSDNGGESFQKISADYMQQCRGIAVDPRNPKRIVTAIASPWWVSETNKPGIYLTQDAGKSWARLSDMPGEGMAWHVTLSPEDPNTIYVGTNGIGAWKTTLPSTTQKSSSTR